MTPVHPLIASLIARPDCPLIQVDGLDDFCGAPGDAVLLCGGDPVLYPECLDLAIVLPEILRAFPGRLRCGVASPDLEPIAQARFGFARWPSLVFVRGGAYVGTLSGIQDWAVYLTRVRDLLAAPPGRPPSIGIAVTATAATCH